MPEPPEHPSPGAAVYCPECGAQFGGMEFCPWCPPRPVRLLPIPNADPTAVAFYEAIR